jgi:hypothetical protein
MTIRLTIKNDDPQRTATVREETFVFGGGPVQQAAVSTRELGPGVEAAFYIHAAKRLIVSENADATQPKPPAKEEK